MELFIKNLLVIRCMMIVKLELEKIGLNCYELELRRVVTKEVIKTNFSEYLSKKSDFNFTCIANLFSETAGNTIEQFIIKQRIKWVKDLIWLDEFTLNENSRRWHYICVVPLSTQFKKVSGLNPTCFKQMRLSHIGLESV